MNNIPIESKKNYTDEFILLGVLVMAKKYGYQLGYFGFRNNVNIARRTTRTSKMLNIPNLINCPKGKTIKRIVNIILSMIKNLILFSTKIHFRP